MSGEYEYRPFDSSVEEGSPSRRYDFEFDEEDYSSPNRNPNQRRSNQEEDEEEELRQRNNQEEEEDDEQQQQKLNGKIESLQQRIDRLEVELVAERQQKVEIQQRYEAELQLAQKELEVRVRAAVEEGNNRPISSAANSKPSTANDNTQLQAEVKRWKTKCEHLQEKLEMALVSNPHSGGGSAAVPGPIQEELVKYCQKYSVYSELQDKLTLNVNDCLKILQSMHNQLRKAKISNRAKAESKHGDEDEQSLTSNPVKERLQAYHEHHRLHDKIKALEEELKLAANHADDLTHLKNRVLQLSERIRQEKEYKRNFELEGLSLKKKVDMLSDHIEKLVLHIKREGAAKVKFAEQSRVLDKENAKMKERYDGLARKMGAKDRLIFELREGSRVLEDQLKLMDEKYLELRNKLDYARYVSAKKIKKAEKAAADLRIKYALSGGVVPLDSLPMPSSVSTAGSTFDNMSFDSANYQRMMMNRSNTGFDGLNDSFGPSTTSTNGKQPLGSIRRGSSSKLQLTTDGSIVGGPDGIPTITTQSSFKTANSLLSLDDVLEKIRVQQGNRNDWTEDKVRKFVSDFSK